MKLKALSHYAGDTDTRFGDCILLYDATTLIVYDCGNERHAEEVEKFLKNNSLISEVHVVISHNDEDHTKGVITLFDRLYDEGYDVTVYSSLYLKSAKKVLDILDDDRRTLKGTKERILKTFDHIKEIVEKAQEYNFTVKDAAVNTKVASGSIVGPTEDEFVSNTSMVISLNLGVYCGGIVTPMRVTLDLKWDLKWKPENGETNIIKYRINNHEIFISSAIAEKDYEKQWK